MRRNRRPLTVSHPLPRKRRPAPTGAACPQAGIVASGFLECRPPCHQAGPVADHVDCAKLAQDSAFGFRMGTKRYGTVGLVDGGEPAIDRAYRFATLEQRRELVFDL